MPLDEATPDHSTLTVTRKRLGAEVFDEVFQFVLRIADEKRLLSGKTVGVDSTTLEANAAMKSIVRRDTGEDWKEYVTRLMREEGVIEPDATAERRRDSPLRQKAEEDGLERRVGFADRSRRADHEDERRPHAPGLQGRARGRSGERDLCWRPRSVRPITPTRRRWSTA